MTVKIGHAHSDENRRAKGGKAGDQTGRELVIQEWYLRTEGWSAVFRAKDIKLAEKIANAMEQACLNKNIGYDQEQRTTLYKYAEKCNFDISKISEKCECDCSSLVAVCLNAAGVEASKDMYTGNQKAILKKTGKFDILTNPKYLTKSDYLKRGDIILGPGHTAVVIATGSILDGAKSYSKDLVGIYEVSATKLNIRYGAGTNKDILTVIPKGTKVKCYGYYTDVLDTKWFYIQFTYTNKQYTGYASSKYLTKYI
jgi:hypothetical protein